MEKKITKKQIKKLEKRERNKKDKDWREAVKLRDESKCVICGRTDIVHVHHLLPREMKTFRWNIDNGICLCPNHHKFSIEISPHRNALAFIQWLILNRKSQLERLGIYFL